MRRAHRRGQALDVDGRILVASTNFLLESFDEDVCRREIGPLCTFVHRGVTASPESRKFGIEFMGVEYAWIQHVSILCLSGSTAHAFRPTAHALPRQ